MEIDYYGTVVSEATLEGLLRTAVVHTPPTNDRDLAFDPDGWTSGLLGQIRATPLEAIARDVFTAMARTGSAAELRFAAKHDFGRDLISPDVLLDALERATEPETRAGLARSIEQAMRAGKLAYSARLRLVLGEASVQDPLLGAIALHDHAAFVDALDKVFADASSAALRVAYAVTGLNHAEMTVMRGEILASTLPDAIRNAAIAALDEMLAHPATVANEGPVRW